LEQEGSRSSHKCAIPLVGPISSPTLLWSNSLQRPKTLQGPIHGQKKTLFYKAQNTRPKNKPYSNNYKQRVLD